MRLSTAINLHGRLEITVRRHGGVIEEWSDPNMIMAASRDVLARLVAGVGGGQVIAKIGIGTNGTTPAPSDTSLTSALIKPVTSFSFPATGEVEFAWGFGESEANGMVIREFGLITADGQLFARKSRGAIEKDEDLDLSGRWTLIF